MIKSRPDLHNPKGIRPSSFEALQNSTAHSTKVDRKGTTTASGTSHIHISSTQTNDRQEVVVHSVPLVGNDVGQFERTTKVFGEIGAREDQVSVQP